MGEAAHAEGGLLHGIEHPTGSAHVDMLEGDVKRNCKPGCPSLSEYRVHEL